MRVGFTNLRWRAAWLAVFCATLGPPAAAQTVGPSPVEVAALEYLRDRYPGRGLGFDPLRTIFERPREGAPAWPDSAIPGILSILGARLSLSHRARGCTPQTDPECVEVVLRLGQVEVTGDSATVYTYAFELDIPESIDVQIHLRRTADGWQLERESNFRAALYSRMPTRSDTSGTAVDTISLPDRQALFEATVIALRDEERAPVLRVDPRPLAPDPALITLRRLSLPAEGAQQAALAPFALFARADGYSRRTVLTRLAIAEMDGLAYTDCPLSSPPPSRSPEPNPGWSLCPDPGFRVAFLALPRRGDSWTPGHDVVDVGNREVYSVRAIVRQFEVVGGLEYSADFVFERIDGRWVFLNRVMLTIIE